MAFKKPPAILERVMRFRALQHKEGGKLTLWNINCVLFPLYTIVHLGILLEKEYGIKKTQNILFTLGKVQARMAVQLINKRFGYAKKITDKKDLLEFNTGQISIAGHGYFKWHKIDLKNKIFIMQGKSSVAETHKQILGIGKYPIDHFKRGEVAAGIEEIFGIKVLPIETECIATGKKYCQFVAKPYEEWGKKNPLVKSQWVEEIPAFKEKGIEQINLY